jgi:methionyl-tRNA synthetase
MILMTEDESGKLVFVNPDTSTTLSAGSDGVSNGLKIS